MRLRDVTRAPAFQRAAGVLAAKYLRLVWLTNVPRDADDAVIESYRVRREAELKEVTRRAYAAVGREDSHG